MTTEERATNIRPMYVCVCNAVRDRDLREAAASGVRCFDELKRRTGVSTCCGRCEDTARQVFSAALEPRERSSVADLMPGALPQPA